MGEEGGRPGHAGWVRKQCSRGLLGGGWKERYIRLDRGRLLIYEQQGDIQCEETVDLGKYQCCQELRGLIKKRKQFRLALVRSTGTKVPEPKFQVPNAEEKDLWLSALNEAIKEANNEQFDQVTVDEKSSLDHLTRNRVKINHSRRPPTRQHRREVATAVSDGMQRLELGAQNLITEDKSEVNSKGNVRDHANTNRVILMPKVKPSNAKVNIGSGVMDNQSKEPVTEEGAGPVTDEGAGPVTKEGMGPVTEEGDGPVTNKEEGPVTNGGKEKARPDPIEWEKANESDCQANVSRGDELKKLSFETNSVSSLSRASLSRVKCSSMGDLLGESKPKGMKKGFKAYFADLKNENVEKMEGEIALELKGTQKLLNQVSQVLDPGEQSDSTQNGQSTKHAAHLLNEAMAKWSEADKVLQELKDLKEFCKKSEALTLEEKVRRKNLLTIHRRSVP
ncbi:uncharacterized protein LOC144609009 [Rhinoraja longicauda]